MSSVSSKCSYRRATRRPPTCRRSAIEARATLRAQPSAPVDVPASIGQPARDRPIEFAQLGARCVAVDQDRSAVEGSVVVERSYGAHAPPAHPAQHPYQRSMGFRLLSGLPMLGPQPDTEFVQKRVALAKLACHDVQPRQAAALALGAAAARALLVMGKHAGEATTASGRDGVPVRRLG